LHKVDTNRQTNNKQTNNADYISSLAEVITNIKRGGLQLLLERTVSACRSQPLTHTIKVFLKMRWIPSEGLLRVMRVTG